MTNTNFHSKIREEIKEAMRQKDAVKLNVLRGILSAGTNELVAQGKKPNEEISDDDLLNVIRRLVKQRKDSIEQFKKGGREELAESEEAELKVLEEYLPAQMSKEEIEKVARAKKEELAVTDKSKMGILMGAVMSELKGKADGKDVKEVIESLFE